MSNVKGVTSAPPRGGDGWKRTRRRALHARTHRLPFLLVLAIVVLVGSAPGTVRAHDDPDFGAEGMLIMPAITPLPHGFWWDHTTLTVSIRAEGSAPAEAVSAVREARGIWNAAIAHRHRAGFVQLVEVSGGREAAQADVVAHLIARGGRFSGQAICDSGRQCQVPIRESLPQGLGFEPFNCVNTLNNAMHERGHVLGVGHAIPLVGSVDVMGYSGRTTTTISACNMDAFDVAWVWAINGEAPPKPTITEIAC